MKTIASLLLIALLVSSNGCMTAATIKRGKGYTDEQVQPLKGDTVFLHGGLSYVVQQKQPEGENAKKMPPTALQPYPPPYRAYKPSPGCYPFLIVTVPLDAATFPLQAIGVGFEYWFVH